VADDGKTETQAGKAYNRHRAFMYSRKNDLESNHLRSYRERTITKDTALIHIAVRTTITLQAKEAYHAGRKK
jgi:hypothetical protein